MGERENDIINALESQTAILTAIRERVEREFQAVEAARKEESAWRIRMKELAEKQWIATCKEENRAEEERRAKWSPEERRWHEQQEERMKYARPLSDSGASLVSQKEIMKYAFPDYKD
jgi:uncharacterized protein YbbC (DUF1343 family)